MEIEFKNRKTYELEDAGRDGILVFKDVIFKAPFDKGGYTNVWETCSLKKRIESWWKKNAPDVLKEKYDVSMLSMEEVCDKKEIDRLFYGSIWKSPKSNQLPLFAKDWKARIKRLPDGKPCDYWWLRSPDPWSGIDAAGVGIGGSPYSHNASNIYGCVPALYPKVKEESK